MKDGKKEKTIVCRYGEFGTIELEVLLDKSVPVKQFSAMRRRLMRRERGVFFSDVVLEANSLMIYGSVGACVKAHQLVLVLTIYSDEMKNLTGDAYCIDCSLLRQSPSRRKPAVTRKSK